MKIDLMLDVRASEGQFAELGYLAEKLGFGDGLIAPLAKHKRII